MPLTIEDIELLNSYQDRITAAIDKLADIAEMYKSANHPQSADYTVAIAINISLLKNLSNTLDRITNNIGEATEEAIASSLEAISDNIIRYKDIVNDTARL